MPSIAFVTAYLKIYEDDIAENSRHRNLEWRMNLFHTLAATQLPLYLFCSPEFEYLFTSEDFVSKYPNVTLVQILNIEDTWTWKTLGEIAQEKGLQELELPEQRNQIKDTKKYLALQNAKVEFVQKAMELYPHYQHYSWIDFSIVSILKHPEISLEYMRSCYGQWIDSKPEGTRYFYIPGCWKQPWYEPDKDAITKRVHWRYCGGFFIADRQSMQQFTEVYQTRFPNYLREFGVLTWEVNFWAWLEIVQTFLEPDESKHWKPHWFQADHNDSMIRTPISSFIRPLIEQHSPHAHLENFEFGTNLSLLEKPQEGLEWPGSSCFLNSSKYGRLVNTRVMNYWLYPNGYYRFHTDDKILRTRNLLSFVDEKGQAISTFPVIENLGETVLKKHNPTAFSQGLEDVRIWSVKDGDGNGDSDNERLRFICTNVNYSPTGNGRMIVGDLKLTTNDLTDFVNKNSHWIPVMENAVNVLSPRETWMEKNWVPLVLNNQEHFIYQWSPFELGILRPEGENARLQIVKKIESKNPTLFEKVRGSSCFVPFPGTEGNDRWLGVVHLSEEGLPRKYYHMLVTLDENGIPERYSAPFQFCKEGIEFCIGFETYSLSDSSSSSNTTLEDVGLRFWISRHDRDPSVLTIPMHLIPFTGVYKKSTLDEPETETENITMEIKMKEVDQIETPIHIYILCFNEELLIPHTIAHYRRYLPSAVITVYDNESTDRSAQIAKELGCEVVSWNSENIQNEYIQRDMRNNIWKKGPEKGWKLMIDMDEWLCVTEAQLREEEANGTSILRVKGVNVMGQSLSPQLEDISFDELEAIRRVVDWSQESKNLCFLTPEVREMNYTHGAHACFPNGSRIQFSEKRYYNKHMENLGLPFFIQKFVRRAERNKIMHAHQINLHYTDDIKKITDRYEELMGQSYLIESFDRFSA